MRSDWLGKYIFERDVLMISNENVDRVINYKNLHSLQETIVGMKSLEFTHTEFTHRALSRNSWSLNSTHCLMLENTTSKYTPKVILMWTLMKLGVALRRSFMIPVSKAIVVPKHFLWQF